MKYNLLGKSTLNVSKICLGCMGFGDGSGSQNWAISQEKADEIIKTALDAGINFFDTANCYGNGSSEIVLGNALKKFAKRENVIIATKVYFNEGKLSKQAIFKEIDKSLKRLQTTYIDLYIIHRFDYDTPIEETMEALHSLVKAKKVRYIGASAMYAYQFAKMQDIARQKGYTEFISMQNHYNLLYREEEREMNKLLLEEHVSSTPYSPLAGGRLARNWVSDTLRNKLDDFAKSKYDDTKDIDYPIVLREIEIANKYQVSQSEVAIAWLLSKEVVGSIIVGASKIKHIEDAIKAVDLKLSPEDINYLEELYVPHKVVGALDKGE